MLADLAFLLDGREESYREEPPEAAMTIVTELHDIRRFESARSLMAYLGLVPSQHSGGGREMRGAITKTGNTHVRRILVEAVHHVRQVAGPLTFAPLEFTDRIR